MPYKLRLTDAQLGKHGEDFATRLLEDRGYKVEPLPTNSPTYDLKVVADATTFLVSVKVSRTRPHVRLGQRKSVLGLESKHFVFAFSPQSGGEIENLSVSPYELLILPAAKVRSDSLAIHDRYWNERSKDPNIFSVMVKGYDRYGRPTWQDWQQYLGAWSQLPPPRSVVAMT